jgi:hypothetical protein
MERVSINEEAKGFINDRATVVIQAHYQEFDPPQMASLQHAFDYTNPAAAAAHMKTQKVHVSQRTPIDIGECEWGECLLILSHEAAAINKAAPDALRLAMQSNKIILTNTEGEIVGILRHRFASVVEYPFPVFVQATNATALLSVTAYPIIDNEKVPSE